MAKRQTTEWERNCEQDFGLTFEAIVSTTIGEKSRRQLERAISANATFRSYETRNNTRDVGRYLRRALRNRRAARRKYAVRENAKAR